MSKRYSGKSFKDASVMKKAKLSFKEKRKLKREKKRINNVNIGLVCSLYYILFCSISFRKFRTCARGFCCLKRNSHLSN